MKGSAVQNILRFWQKIQPERCPCWRKRGGAGDTNTFYLAESNAILTHLAAKHNWDDVYPSGTRAGARINEYLHYHHRSARDASSMVIPIMRRDKLHLYPPDMLNAMRSNFQKCVETLETGWLARSAGGKYLVGDSLTLADIACYMELGQLQPRFANLWDFSHSNGGRMGEDSIEEGESAGGIATPKLQRWVERMSQVPHHDAIHSANAVVGDLSMYAGTGKGIGIDTIRKANVAFAQAVEEADPRCVAEMSNL